MYCGHILLCSMVAVGGSEIPVACHYQVFDKGKRGYTANGAVLCQKQRTDFSCLIGNINLNRRTKNTHKMGMGIFKESAGMLKNTL